MRVLSKDNVVVIIAFRVELRKKSAWLVDNKAPSTARDSCDIAFALNRRPYPHTGNGGLSGCLRSNIIHSFCPFSLTGTHYLTDISFLLS